MTDSLWSSSNMSVQFSLSGFCAHLLEGSIPLLHQYLNLSQNLLINLLEAHRATSKLLSVLLSIFTDLGTRGFCVPPEIEEGEGDGSTEFEDIEGGGIGEGEGMKDVSDQIENEDQVNFVVYPSSPVFLKNKQLLAKVTSPIFPFDVNVLVYFGNFVISYCLGKSLLALYNIRP